MNLIRVRNSGIAIGQIPLSTLFNNAARVQGIPKAKSPAIPFQEDGAVKRPAAGAARRFLGQRSRVVAASFEEPDPRRSTI
jgi:hypothetical protein